MSQDDLKKQVGEAAAGHVKNGMVVMIEDGLNKIAAGLTTIEEVLRVAEAE